MMKLKTFLTINAIVAIVVGLGFTLEWGFILEPFFSPGYDILSQNSSDAPMIKWLLASFVRMFGMMLFGLGALTMVVRDVNEKGLRRKIVITLLLIWTPTTLIAWAQQIAIWGTPAGWLVVLFCAVQAGGYAFYFFRGELDAWRPRSQPLNQEDRDYNLELIRYVTQNYASLQGLRVVPLGVWFLMFATGALGAPGALNALGIFLGVSAVVLWWWIGRYYQGAFGAVKVSKSSPLWLPGMIVFWALFLLASWLDYTWRLPFSITWLLIGSVLIGCWSLPTYRRRVHYLVMGLLALGLSFAFTFVVGFSLDNDVHRQFLGNFFNVFLGLMCIVGGSIDHLILMRAFKPLPGEVSHE
jgi:hypothetical protein